MTENQKITKLFKKCLKNFNPPEKLTVTQWADKYRYLSSEASAMAGKYRSRQTPYMVEIMDCYSDPNVEKIFVVASSQVGKTEALGLNILGYIIDNDPCGVIFAVPTIQDAKDFAKERVMPMIRDNPTIRKKFGSIKSRDASNTIREKTFPGGVLNIVGVNVPSQLASKPRRVVIGDEIDRWSSSSGNEGDPWGLLEARTMTFYNRKMIAVSTPTVKGHSRIEDHFLTGTQEYWCYQCPNCGEYHRLRFQDMKFEHHETKEKGKTTIHVDWVKWKCPDCGEMFTEKEVKSFPTKWIATNPAALKNHIRSFWINGFSSPFPVATWEYLIWRFLEAGKDPEKLQTVFNTLFGELWEDRRDLTTEDELMNRRENYEAELPDGVLMLTCAVDTQDDRLEYEVKGWGKFKESWGIKKGYIMGRADSNYVWERLDDIISHAYSFKDGKTMSITVTLVDSGGHYTQAVYANCYKRSSRYVFPIKGVDRKDLALARPLISPPNKQAFGSSNEYRVWLYSIGVNSGKRAVQDFLKVKEHGSMFCHFPLDKDRGYDAKYFNGLLSEVEIRTGNKVEWQIIPGHKRNEPFDLFVYNYAALMLVDPDFDAIEARLRGVKQERKEKPKRKVRKSSAFDMFD